MFRNPWITNYLSHVKYGFDEEGFGTEAPVKLCTSTSLPTEALRDKTVLVRSATDIDANLLAVLPKVSELKKHFESVVSIDLEMNRKERIARRLEGIESDVPPALTPSCVGLVVNRILEEDLPRYTRASDPCEPIMVRRYSREDMEIPQMQVSSPDRQSRARGRPGDQPGPAAHPHTEPVLSLSGGPVDPASLSSKAERIARYKAERRRQLSERYGIVLDQEIDMDYSPRYSRSCRESDISDRGAPAVTERRRDREREEVEDGRGGERESSRRAPYSSRLGRVFMQAHPAEAGQAPAPGHGSSHTQAPAPTRERDSTFSEREKMMNLENYLLDQERTMAREPRGASSRPQDTLHTQPQQTHPQASPQEQHLSPPSSRASSRESYSVAAVPSSPLTAHQASMPSTCYGISPGDLFIEQQAQAVLSRHGLAALSQSDWSLQTDSEGDAASESLISWPSRELTKVELIAMEVDPAAGSADRERGAVRRPRRYITPGDNRKSSERFRTQPITSAEWLESDRSHLTPTVLQNPEADEEKLDERAKMSVAAKRSLFRELEKITGSVPRPRSRDPARERRLLRVQDCSHTQPITNEEVDIAHTGPAMSSQTVMVHSTVAHIPSPTVVSTITTSLQEASQHDSKVRSMGEQEREREAQSRQAGEEPGPESMMEDLGPDEPDLSTLSLVEKMALFNQLSTQPSKPAAKGAGASRVDTRQRRANSRFQTQPITQGEVDQLQNGDGFKLEPLSASLVRSVASLNSQVATVTTVTSGRSDHLGKSTAVPYNPPAPTTTTLDRGGVSRQQRYHPTAPEPQPQPQSTTAPEPQPPQAQLWHASGSHGRDADHASVSLRTATTVVSSRSVSHSASIQQQQKIQSFTQPPQTLPKPYTQQPPQTQPQSLPQPYSHPPQHHPFTQALSAQPKPQERERRFTQPLPKPYSQITPHTQPNAQSLSQPPPPIPQTLTEPTSFPQSLVKSQSLPLDNSEVFTGHSVSDLLSSAETELSEMSAKQMSIKERLALLKKSGDEDCRNRINKKQEVVKVSVTERHSTVQGWEEERMVIDDFAAVTVSEQLWEPVFSSTYSPPISLGHKCQVIDPHSQRMGKEMENQAQMSIEERKQMISMREEAWESKGKGVANNSTQYTVTERMVKQGLTASSSAISPILSPVSTKLKSSVTGYKPQEEIEARPEMNLELDKKLDKLETFLGRLNSRAADLQETTLTVTEKALKEVMRMDDEIFSKFYRHVADFPRMPSRIEIDDDFDAIFGTQAPKLTSALAQHKRAVRPSRNVQSSKNPLKMLAAREDIRHEYTEQRLNIGLIESKRMKDEKLNTSTQMYSDAALAGLASEENLNNVSLRSVNISEQMSNNSAVPYKNLMLMQVKGRRHVQTRLVEPRASALNSGDCFLLVTPQHCFVWMGEFANVIEKAKVSPLPCVCLALVKSIVSPRLPVPDCVSV
uniref:Gelsolin-like domain-containing protein n=1 Tax=Hucho hucho TaxID=62062 RepID=A0A4W5MWN0_9TELE